MKRQVALGSLVGAFAVYGACSAVGQMMDGGNVRDAQAQSMPQRATCDRVTVAGGAARYYYAEFSVPGISPTTPRRVQAFVCDDAPLWAQTLCSDATCSGYNIPGPTCTQALYIIAQDRVAVRCDSGRGISTTARATLLLD